MFNGFAIPSLHFVGPINQIVSKKGVAVRLEGSAASGRGPGAVGRCLRNAGDNSGGMTAKFGRYIFRVVLGAFLLVLISPDQGLF